MGNDPSAVGSTLAASARRMTSMRQYMRWIVRVILLGAVTAGGCAPVDDAGSQPSAAAGTEHLAVAPRPEKATSGPRDPFRERLEAAIQHVEARDLQTSFGFWTIFHGILGQGFQTTLFDPETGRRFNALDYISKGGQLRGLVFIPTPHGLDVQMGPQYVGQGHQDQFVAEMAQWGMKADWPLVVHGKNYTFMDFVRNSQMRARVTADQELSWTILVVAHYLGLELTWTNQFNERLSLEDMLRYELAQPITQAACGGTHRLFGLSWVYHLHRARGGAVTGVWKDIDDFTIKHIDLIRRFQNSDGSLSARYFAGPGQPTDVTEGISTTGHTVEWLALALSDAELRAPWMQAAVNRLALMMLDMRDVAVDGGALYHALHGLKIYHARVFAPASVGTDAMPIPPHPTNVIPPKVRPATAAHRWVW